jgi:hypothetical protein
MSEGTVKRSLSLHPSNFLIHFLGMVVHLRNEFILKLAK